MRHLLLTCMLLVAMPLAAQTPNANRPARRAKPGPPARQAPDSRTASNDKDLLLQRASAELTAGRRAEAAQLLRSAAERFQSVQALLQLARLQSGDGDAPRALESLSRARAIAPNSEDVLSAFAQVALAARAPMPAIMALQSLSRMCPTVAQYHYLLGVALMQSGDMPGAVESLEEAEHLEPNDLRTLIALGFALNNRKLFAEAKPLLLRSLELQPENVDAVAALAESEEGLGELQAAEEHARRALATSSAHPIANLAFGMVLMKQERFAEARDAFEKALAADPTSPKTYYQMSLAYARLGDEVNSRKYVDLYQQKLRESQERVKALRGETRRGDGEPRR